MNNPATPQYRDALPAKGKGAVRLEEFDRRRQPLPKYLVLVGGGLLEKNSQQEHMRAVDVSVFFLIELLMSSCLPFLSPIFQCSCTLWSN